MEPRFEECYNRVHSPFGCFAVYLVGAVTVAFCFIPFYDKNQIRKEVYAYESSYPVIVNGELQPLRLSYALSCNGFGDEELSDLLHERDQVLARYSCPSVETWECREINLANKEYPGHTFSFTQQEPLKPVTCSKTSLF